MELTNNKLSPTITPDQRHDPTHSISGQKKGIDSAGRHISELTPDNKNSLQLLCENYADSDDEQEETQTHGLQTHIIIDVTHSETNPISVQTHTQQASAIDIKNEKDEAPEITEDFTDALAEFDKELTLSLQDLKDKDNVDVPQPVKKRKLEALKVINANPMLSNSAHLPASEIISKILSNCRLNNQPKYPHNHAEFIHAIDVCIQEHANAHVSLNNKNLTDAELFIHIHETAFNILNASKSKKINRHLQINLGCGHAPIGVALRLGKKLVGNEFEIHPNGEFIKSRTILDVTVGKKLTENFVLFSYFRFPAKKPKEGDDTIQANIQYTLPYKGNKYTVNAHITIENNSLSDTIKRILKLENV